MEFSEIWNEAYNLACEDGEEAMRAFLKEKVAKGFLTAGDSQAMAEDIMETLKL